ncbi:MAG: flagellar hook-basal body complex protein, partial [Limnobacter sp.]|nr:flagellar hook-basal body complex protein [Limnobacter sp.]
QGAIPPSATTTSALQVNVDARLAGTATAFNPTDLNSFEHSTSMTVYDQLGDDHTLSVYFKRQVGTNIWEVHARTDGVNTPMTSTVPVGTNPALVQFDVDGNLVAGTVALTVDTTALPVAFNPANSFTFDLAKSSQFGSAFQVQDLSQDGYTSSPFAGYDVGSDGNLSITYANGEVRDIFKVGLFKFKNPEGLQPIGSSGWLATEQAGPELISLSEETAFGTIQSGALEEANVDLTSELVAMISAQRVYQANSQTIKTQDQVLQTITNLR